MKLVVPCTALAILVDPELYTALIIRDVRSKGHDSLDRKEQGK